MAKLWQGRFSKPTDESMSRFNDSISFDRVLYDVDIAGSIAYAEALKKIGIFNHKECSKVVRALIEIRNEFAEGEFLLNPSDEDIHTAVERRLIEKVGEVGSKLHTGRSRNEQVVTDVRLFMMEKSEGLIRKIASLQEAVLLRAKKESDIIMPGYTHLQQAQPILWSHYLMALFWMLQRDRERVRSCQERLSVSPLGSGALAGIAYPINREELAKELGFSSESENSIDAVSDRDFIIEFLATCTILMMHLSRFSEDLTIWSSVEFGFVEVDQAYATGSSLMPQKKNPDSLELIRGKAARVIGSLTTVLSMMKGVPLTYSKDLQEDKEPLFDSIATVFMSLEVFTGVLATMEVRRERMLSSMDEKVYATDVADYLTKKGVPFRKAHEIVGRLVQQLVVEGKKFSDLPLPVYKGFSRLFEYDIYRVFDSRRSVDLHSVKGGTSRKSLSEQFRKANRCLKKLH